MEGRLTLCNMSIEAGGRAGMVAPDDETFAYLHGREYAPKGQDWDDAVARWRELPSDRGAEFDAEVFLDADAIEPMVTWGTSPESWRTSASTASSSAPARTPASKTCAPPRRSPAAGPWPTA